MSMLKQHLLPEGAPRLKFLFLQSSGQNLKSQWLWKSECYFILFYLFFLSSPEGERGKETLMWETSISCLSYVTLPTRDWTQTQSCALTSNWACSLLVHGLMLQTPEPHRPGHGEWYFRKFSHKTGPFPDKNNFGLQTLFLLVIGIPYISSLTLYTL